MRTARILLGALGVATAVYGGFLLLTRQPVSALGDLALWLAGGVVAHDLILAAATATLLAVGRRLLPRRVRGPAAVGMLVLGSLTLLAIPVLGRFGARADNPTLLDRDYLAGWAVVAGVIVLGVLVGSLVPRRGGRARPRGRSPE